MRRELCAGALLLLLIAGAVWNLHIADRLTERVSDSLGRAEQAARREDYDGALQALEEALELWDGAKTYTQMFFRQPDLDGLQDAFSDLGQLLRQEDPAWPAALDLLRYHLDMVDRMEHLSLGTIF
ncbi:MAG: DUF4363 family protein [Oscillospiraceae bacterium]|nr:DUF4363 family protein [Oscillospiraceae bacterium]